MGGGERAIVIKDRRNIMLYTEHPCIASSSTFKKERDAWKLWETSHLVHTLNSRLTCVEENRAPTLGETAGKKTILEKKAAPQPMFQSPPQYSPCHHVARSEG